MYIVSLKTDCSCGWLISPSLDCITLLLKNEKIEVINQCVQFNRALLTEVYCIAYLKPAKP